MKRKLIKFSNYSFCITLPKKAVEKLGWSKGEEVDVDFEPKTRRIIVTKEKKSQDSPKVSEPNKTSSDDPRTDGIQPIPRLRW